MDTTQDLEAEVKDLLALLAEIVTRLLNGDPQTINVTPCAEDA